MSDGQIQGEAMRSAPEQTLICGDVGVTLHLGDWRSVLADVTCALLCSDPPYSDRVHVGQRSGDLSSDLPTINYDAMTRDLAYEFARSWAPRVSQWVVLFCDHIAFRWHEEAWDDAGWFVFAPVYWVKPDAAPRKVGDGPTCAVEQIMVARPPSWPEVRGSRRGFYMHPVAELRGCGQAGAKPLGLMRDLIEDYSQPNETVCDPFAGSGTTLMAARQLGRRCIGAEVRPEAYARAVDRLRGLGPSRVGGQPGLFAEVGR